MNKPELGVDCIMWTVSGPMIDRLTDENHYEAYWEESLYAYGDEECFILLPEKPVNQTNNT